MGKVGIIGGIILLKYLYPVGSSINSRTSEFKNGVNHDFQFGTLSPGKLLNLGSSYVYPFLNVFNVPVPLFY